MVWVSNDSGLLSVKRVPVPELVPSSSGLCTGPGLDQATFLRASGNVRVILP